MRDQLLEVVARVLHREQHLELLDEPSLDGNLVLEITRQCAATLNGDFLDVVVLELPGVLGVGNLRRGIGTLRRELNDRDGDEYDENPERELLRSPAPVCRFPRIFVPHLLRHYRKIAMYGKWRTFSA